MIVYLMWPDRLETITLPPQVRGQSVIETTDSAGKKIPLIRVNGDGQLWKLQNSSSVHAEPESSEANSEGILANHAMYRIEAKGIDQPCMLLCASDNPGNITFSSYLQSAQIIVKDTDHAGGLVYRHPLLKYCGVVEIIRSNGTIYARRSSGTGSIRRLEVYLNGKALQRNTELKIGDCLFVLGLKIVIGPGFISINNPGGLVRSSLTPLKPIPFTPGFDVELAAEEGSGFSPAPRNVREIVPLDISLQDPPQPIADEPMPILLMMGPALTMGVGSTASMVLTINNLMASGASITAALPSIITTGSMLLGTLLWMPLSRSFQKRRNARKEFEAKKDYEVYLQAVEEEVAQAIALQTELLIENNPTLDKCKERILKQSPELWQRSPHHYDFMQIGIGIGDLPLQADIKYSKPGYSMDTGEAQDLMKAFIEKERVLENVPLSVDFKKSRVTGIIGQRDKVNQFVKALLVEMTALHDAEDLKIFFIYNEAERKEWEFVKWIPHLWNEDQSIRFLANDPDEIKKLGDVVESLRHKTREQRENKGPHYVIFAADRELAERSPSIKELYKDTSAENITLVAMYDERKYLPKGTDTLISLFDKPLAVQTGTAKDGSPVTRTVQGYVADFNDITGSKIWIRKPVFMQEDPKHLFIEMANIHTGSSLYNGRLPDSYSLMEMLRIGRPEHYDLLGNWKSSDPVNSLAAPIGVDADGYLISLDLHEKAHGAHGAVAGMTGSGKSEFIISYIISMALKFSPEDVSFVFIDFKGGGMADVFKDLPHTAGTITNLDGSELQRSFIAIENELAKRQKLFKQISEEKRISNIDIYKYQKLRQEDPGLKPLPHLILITDEFAELKQQQGDFMGQLIRIARIGRSLGVHLILATQKPDGVVDPQIQSNIRFKVCLKVQEKSDSQSMIGRPDAAWLTRAGRFYMQVGNDELFELGQSPWSGSVYEPSDQFIENLPDTIEALNEQGMVIAQAKLPAKREPGLPEKQIDAMVEFVAKTAAQAGIQASRIWLDPIPAPPVFEGKKENTDNEIREYYFNPKVGTYDDLKNQQHPILRIPISESGNTLLYGMSGSGKLDFLYTLLLDLMKDHSPEEINFWLVDGDAGGLLTFESLPYTRFVSDLLDPSAIREALLELEGELANRKQMFRNYGGDYQSYLRSGKRKPAAQLLVIHNLQNLEESDNSLRPIIIRILREGFKYGIYAVVTGTAFNSVPYAMMPLFKNVYTLQQNNENQYTDIMGRTGGLFPSRYKGRGLVKASGQICEFQTDLHFEQEISPYTAAYEKAAKYAASWQQKQPSQQNGQPDDRLGAITGQGIAGNSDESERVFGTTFALNQPEKDAGQASNIDAAALNPANPANPANLAGFSAQPGFNTRTGGKVQSVSFERQRLKPAGPVSLEELPVGIRPGTDEICTMNVLQDTIFVLMYGSIHAMNARGVLEDIRKGSQNAILYDFSTFDPDQSTAAVNAMINEVLRRREILQSKGENGELPDFDPIVFLMDDACKQLDRLKETERAKLLAYMQRLFPKYRVYFVLAELDENLNMLVSQRYFGSVLPSSGGLMMSAKDTAGIVFENPAVENAKVDRRQIAAVFNNQVLPVMPFPPENF